VSNRAQKFAYSRRYSGSSCGRFGLLCNEGHLPAHDSSRTLVAEHRRLHSPSADDGAIFELRPVSGAMHIRIPRAHVQYTTGVGAKDGVIFGEQFFGHGQPDGARPATGTVTPRSRVI
jgi:hypothetical protein